MILTILGLAFLVVLTIFAYKTAKDYQRNAGLWALLTFAVIFGIQIILPFVVGMIIVIVMLAGGIPQNQLQRRFDEDVPAITINIGFTVLSVVAGFLILRYLSKIPEEKSFIAPPTPPTDFN